MEKALELADTAIAFALENQNTTLLHETQAFQAELALRQGRLSEAFAWARQFVPEPFQAMEGFYVPQLTQVKVLLAQATSESLKQASDLLDSLHDFVLSTHNSRIRIDILALQALLHHVKGEEQGAMEKMNEALKLAEPGGFIRNFVDMGPSMAELLAGMIRQNTHVIYIGKLLTAFRDSRFSSDDLRFESESRNPIKNQKSKIEHCFIEPLTRREAEIMALLTQRFYNNEIAEKLFISTETVKKHLYNIYQKFNVNNRRQAVKKAQALGMLAGS
jgi:LuxR family maltose regulon positive regulatory protein